MAVPLRAGPAARAAADDPVAPAVRVRRRAAGVARSPTCSTPASTSSTRSSPARPMNTTVHGPVKLWVVVRHRPRARRRASSATTSSTGWSSCLTYALPGRLRGLHRSACWSRCTTRPGSFDLGGFKWTPFLVQFGVVAGYQISWAIYVSDYSRYLPPDVTVRKTFYWTYCGSALGAVWLMCLGSLLAAWAGKGFDTIDLDQRRRRQDLRRLRRDRPGLLRARPGLGDRTQHVRRFADADQRGRLLPHESARPSASGSLTIAVTAALSLVGALAATVALPVQLQRLPAAGALPLHPVDRGQPGRLLRGPARPLRDRRDLQPARDLRSLGVARDHRLPGRLRRDGARSSRSAPSSPARRHTPCDGADISLFIGLPVSAILYWWLGQDDRRRSGDRGRDGARTERSSEPHQVT